MRPYLDPHDHAFANGPVFQRPRNAAEARGMFDRAEDGDRLMEVFDAFLSRADVGEGLGDAHHEQHATRPAQQRREPVVLQPRVLHSPASHVLDRVLSMLSAHHGPS